MFFGSSYCCILYGLIKRIGHVGGVVIIFFLRAGAIVMDNIPSGCGQTLSLLLLDSLLLLEIALVDVEVGWLLLLELE